MPTPTRAPRPAAPRTPAKSTAAKSTAAKSTAAKSTPAKSTPAKSPAASASPATPAKRTGKSTLIDSRLAYQGKVFSVYTDTVLEPGATEPHTRDVIRHSGSVVILAIDERPRPDGSGGPVDPDVILIRQYRHAAGQFLLELPAGRIEPGENPLAAARREMIEETGFRARKWTLLTKYFASPGFLGEWMQIYLARDIVPGTAHPEADEHIQILPTPLSKAMEMVAANQIHDGKTLIGLSLLSASRNAAGL